MWDFRAQLLDVIDGDTIRVLIDNGFHSRSEVDLRLWGVSAPERNQLGGPETHAFVRAWMDRTVQTPLRWPLYVQTYQTTTVEPSQKMTFTRYLATVWRMSDGLPPLAPALNRDLADFLAEHPAWGHGI